MKVSLKSCVIFTMAMLMLTRYNPILSQVPGIFWIPIILGCALLAYVVLIEKKIPTSSYIGWICSITFFALFTMVWAEVSSDVLYTSIVMLENLPIYILINICIKKKSDLEDFMTNFLKIAFVNSICYLLTSNSIGDGGRIGDTINSNTVGMYMAFAIWMLMVYVIDFKKRKLIYTDYFFLMLWLLTLLLSGSKKGILALFLLIMIRQCIKARQTFFVILKYLVILIIALVLLRYIPFLYDTIGYRIWDMIEMLLGNTESDYSTFQRINFIVFGLQAFIKKPIIGYGIGNYHNLSYAHFGYAWYDTYSHCNYIEILVSGGLVYFILYYSQYIKTVFSKNIWHHANKIKKAYVLSIMLTIMVCEFAVVDYYAAFYHIMICFAVSMLGVKELDER